MIEKIFTCITEAAISAGSRNVDFYIEVFMWIPKREILEVNGKQIFISGLTRDNLEDCLEFLSIFRPSISDYQRVGTSSVFKIKMKNPQRKQIGFLIS